MVLAAFGLLRTAGSSQGHQSSSSTSRTGGFGKSVWALPQAGKKDGIIKITATCSHFLSD